MQAKYWKGYLKLIQRIKLYLLLFLFVIISDRNRYNRGNALGDDTSGGQGGAATDGAGSSNKIQWTCFGAILIILSFK